MAANDGAPEFQVGARVIVHHSVGVVRYIGETEFADGEWIGVELDYPVGNNDGMMMEQRYFRCRDKHGVFVRRRQVRSVVDAGNKGDQFGPEYTVPDVQDCSGIFTEAEIDRLAPHIGPQPDQRLWLFGENHLGQLGLGHQRENALVPALVDVFNKYEESQVRLLLQLALGENQSLALICTEPGKSRVLICGSCSMGTTIPDQERDQLLFKDVRRLLDPVRVAIAVAVSPTMGAVAYHDGKVLAWGHSFGEKQFDMFHTEIVDLQCTRDAVVACNSTGLVRAAFVDKSSTIIDVQFDDQTRITSIACGLHAGLALSDQGVVWQWDMREGRRASVTHIAAQHVVFVDECVVVQQVASGDRHFLALDSEGVIYSWGCGQDGALGNGSLQDQNVPTVVSSLAERVVEIGCGSRHSICLTDQQRVLTWGNGHQGQLGHGDLSNFTLPHSVISLEGKGIRQVGAGAGQSLACTSKFVAPSDVLPAIAAVAAPTGLNRPTSSARPVGASLNMFDGTMGQEALSDLLHHARSSELRTYEWNGKTIDLDSIQSEKVQLVHRCVQFQVDEDMQYRGALNQYFRRCYESDSYVFKNLVTSISVDENSPTGRRVVNGTLLLICRPRSADATAVAVAIPEWITLFIDAFYPIDVQPRFVELTPSSEPSKHTSGS
ncbi:CAP-Gly domain-containing protein [Plasmodiophora brassicae]|uniref:CAP-Gly domain-containing protein n=1 Tax=Plasmodiophora brassicae TaxID=37360 RepID=A0A0G4IRJ7_PLABS|nr:hypothetical protein PBRA_005931 [Plasmodiophora brassicae]